MHFAVSAAATASQKASKTLFLGANVIQVDHFNKPDETMNIIRVANRLNAATVTSYAQDYNLATTKGLIACVLVTGDTYTSDVICAGWPNLIRTGISAVVIPPNPKLAVHVKDNAAASYRDVVNTGTGLMTVDFTKAPYNLAGKTINLYVTKA